jgi:hypothetical protein
MKTISPHFHGPKEDAYFSSWIIFQIIVPLKAFYILTEYIHLQMVPSWSNYSTFWRSNPAMLLTPEDATLLKTTCYSIYNSGNMCTIFPLLGYQKSYFELLWIILPISQLWLITWTPLSNNFPMTTFFLNSYFLA